ncbi:MAG: hypothetical protein ABL901_14965 [Hyphomicrobiaceae bacterium]
MASYTQMSRTAADPAAVKGMAAFLLTVAGADWSDWEVDFLEHMREHEGPAPLTMRQREVLFELNDKARSYTDYRGLSVRRLIDQCWLARTDLDDDNESFIAQLNDARPASLKQSSLYRLVRCARQLGIIESDV